MAARDATICACEKFEHWKVDKLGIHQHHGPQHCSCCVLEQRAFAMTCLNCFYDGHCGRNVIVVYLLIAMVVGDGVCRSICP